MAAHTFQAPQLPVLPDMPTAFGAVLQRVSAAMMAPSGLFGRGSAALHFITILAVFLLGWSGCNSTSL